MVTKEDPAETCAQQCLKREPNTVPRLIGVSWGKSYGFTQGQRISRHELTLLSTSCFFTRVGGASTKMTAKVEHTSSQSIAKLSFVLGNPVKD